MDPIPPITGFAMYAALMVCLVGVGWLCSRALPFHRSLSRKELSEPRVFAMDGLRGVLALSVFCHHAALAYSHARTGSWAQPASNFSQQLGVVAVVLFFELSGFIFWAKLLRHGGPRWAPFLYGRAWRIWPAYLFGCVMVFALTAVGSGFRLRVPVHTLLLQGIAWLSLLGAAHDINGLPDSGRLLGQVWTLRYEVRFYITLPLLGWFARVRSRLLPLLALAAFCGGATLLPLHGLAGKMAVAVGEFSSSLAYMFGPGMITAALLLPERAKAWVRTGAASVVSLTLLAATLWWLRPTYGWREGMAVFVPFLCVCHGNTWFGALTSGAMRFLGRISYSFYLLHVIFLEGMISQVKSPGGFGAVPPLRYLGLVALAGTATVVVCAFTYQYLEHPFLHMGKSDRKRTPSPAVMEAAQAKV